MKFRDIPQLIREGSYNVNISWGYLEHWLGDQTKNSALNMDPDFQRGHVWTEMQQVRYCEWILRGGKSGRQILTNCPGWNDGAVDEYVLVDGKQRITAVLRFLHNEISVFGSNYYKDYTDNLRLIGPDFVWNVNTLKTREEVLQWYLDFNSGGVAHSEEEIKKVQELLELEKRTYRPSKATRVRKYVKGPIITGEK